MPQWRVELQPLGREPNIRSVRRQGQLPSLLFSPLRVVGVLGFWLTASLFSHIAATYNNSRAWQGIQPCDLPVSQQVRLLMMCSRHHTGTERSLTELHAQGRTTGFAPVSGSPQLPILTDWTTPAIQSVENGCPLDS